MNIQLFVTALWDEAKEFYYWLLHHAQIIPTSTVLPRNTSLREIKNCLQYLQHDNNNNELYLSPMLQCFAYTKDPDNTTHSQGQAHTQNTPLYCMLLVTGVGKVSSASAVSNIASQIPVSIIKLGAVLGASSTLQQRDIVFPRFFAQHDIDLGSNKKNEQYLKAANMHILDSYVSHNDSYDSSGDNSFASIVPHLQTKLYHSLQTSSLAPASLYTDPALCISGDSFVTLQKITKRNNTSYSLTYEHTALYGTTLYDTAEQVFQLPKPLQAFILQCNTILYNLLQKKNTSNLHEQSHNIAPSIAVIDMENAAVVQAAHTCVAPIIVIAIVLDHVSALKKVNFYKAIQDISSIIKYSCLTYIDIIT